MTELTPNEYKTLTDDQISKETNYRFCVVMNALTKPNLEIFSFVKESKRWISDSGKTLAFQKIISAPESEGFEPPDLLNKSNE